MTNSWLLGRGVPVHIPLPFNVQLLQRPAAMVMPMRMVGSCEKSLCGFESLCNSVLNQVTHTITFQKSFTTTETLREREWKVSKQGVNGYIITWMLHEVLVYSANQ